MTRSRIRVLRPLAALVALLAQLGCGGGGGDDSGGQPIPTECIDVSGTWFVTESASLDCSGFLVDYVPANVSGSGTIEMQQDGCAISYTVPVLGARRSGVVDQNFIQLSGEIAIVQGVDVRENRLTIEGFADPENPEQMSLSGSGVLSVTVDGDSSSCSAASNAVFRR